MPYLDKKQSESISEEMQEYIFKEMNSRPLMQIDAIIRHLNAEMTPSWNVPCTGGYNACGECRYTRRRRQRATGELRDTWKHGVLNYHDPDRDNLEYFAKFQRCRNCMIRAKTDEEKVECMMADYK